MKYGAINGYDELANLIMDTCNMIVDKNIVEIPTSIIACSISILYLMYFFKKNWEGCRICLLLFNWLGEICYGSPLSQDLRNMN